jgi:hypothetical protein
MAGVNVTIPGVAGTVEAKAALMDQAVRHHWNVITAAPEQRVRRPAAGDLGTPLQTARLA